MEIELKLLVEPSDKEKLRRHPLIGRHAVGKPKQDHLRASYFDTPDFHIRRHDAGLRVRKVGGQWIQTMKAGGSVHGGLHQRHEWEVPVDGDRPDLEKLRALVDPGTEWTAMLNSPSLANRLLPLFSVRVKRTTWNLRVEGDEIELVLDEGTIACEGAKVPINEIELELKSGKPERLYDFALQLLEEVPMRLGNSSKAERGYALCTQSGISAVKAETLTLSRDFTVEEGLQAILGNCLAQVQGNEAGVIEGCDSESLHQMRVGLRRLRAALALFEEVVQCPASMLEEIRWLGTELGAARDWDVLLTSTLARVAEAPAAKTELMALQNMVSDVVREKRKAASQALLSSRYARLMLSVFAWLHGTRWRDGSDSANARRLDEPLKEFARHAIERGQRKIARRGRNIRGAAPHTLHRLRIAGKKNRYAVEFFQSLYRPKRVRRYVGALSAMQEELGWRNDVSVADGLLQDLQKAQPGAGAAGFARGYLMAQLKSGERALRKTSKKFRALKMPFEA